MFLLSGASYAESTPKRVLFVQTDTNHPDTGICILAVSPRGLCPQRNGPGVGSRRRRHRETEWPAHTRAVYGIHFILQRAGLVTASIDRTVER